MTSTTQYGPDWELILIPLWRPAAIGAVSSTIRRLLCEQAPPDDVGRKVTSRLVDLLVAHETSVHVVAQISTLLVSIYLKWVRKSDAERLLAARNALIQLPGVAAVMATDLARGQSLLSCVCRRERPSRRLGDVVATLILHAPRGARVLLGRDNRIANMVRASLMCADEFSRLRGIEALILIGQHDRREKLSLLALSKSEREGVGPTAISLLPWFHDEEACSALIMAASSIDRSMQLNALTGLKGMLEFPGVATVVKRLEAVIPDSPDELMNWLTGS